MGRAWSVLRTATVLCLLVAGTAAALGVARPAPASTRHADHGALRLTTGRDGLTLDSSRPGTAILSGAGLAPGDSISGNLSLTARAAFPTDVSLSLSDLIENLGPQGGRLSSVLRLRVLEEPDTGPTRVSYDGLLRDLGTRSLPTYEPGESRTYYFTATLPDSPGINAVQGTSATAAFAWNGQQSTSPTLPPTPPAPVTPDVPQPGTPQAPQADDQGPPPTLGTPDVPRTPAVPTTPAQPARPARPSPPRVLRVRLILPIKQRARARNNTIIGWAVCSHRCRLRYSGRAARATVRVRGRTQRGTRTITLRSVSTAPVVADRRMRLTLRLTPAARRALKNAVALDVTVSVSATDGTGRRADATGTTRVVR
jgi:hypothetical protein